VRHSDLPRKASGGVDCSLVSTLETATTGRAKCRGCGEPIARGDERLGARLPNPYGDGEMTLWFHPVCGAYKRPEAMRAALDALGAADAKHAGLAEIARTGVGHARAQRLDGAERAPSGQARCRSCRTAITKGAWRARLVFFDEGGHFTSGGFVHLECVRAYCEMESEEDMGQVLDRLVHFSPALAAPDVDALRVALNAEKPSES